MAAEARPELVGRFAADDLVASLLLVHGLHPHGVRAPGRGALDSVRPYLGSHGGDVELLEVDATTGRPAAVRGQLQELSVVGGHPRAGRRGRGPGGRAGDLVDRSGGRRTGADARP